MGIFIGIILSLAFAWVSLALVGVITGCKVFGLGILDGRAISKSGEAIYS